MTLPSYPCTYMRGGTSRALIFQESDLPGHRADWDDIFLRALGSPDVYGRQLNGMGGGISSLSKVAILKPSSREDADVEYTFAQVSVTERKVDYKGNCGNISSAIGPYCVFNKWVKGEGSEAHVRIFNTNTQKVIHSRFPLHNDEVIFTGDLQIPGVSGTGAPIQLEFLDPGGATTGRLLPTGQTQDLLKTSQGQSLRASMIDAANACVFVLAKDLGLRGNEAPEELNRPDLLQKLEDLRLQASVTMGIAANTEEAKQSIAIPYLGLVSEAYETGMDFSLRVIASGQPHKALPLTVSLCAAVTAKLPGSLIYEILKSKDQNEIRIGMPSGILTLNAKVEKRHSQWVALSGSFYRTAKILFTGRVYV
ncbi:MAG: PrpF family protein [Bdellovibrio sp. ArHS]|uniref:2-methylaconitate cis-trans isomerase PrpF family protein n=1 Tax=Bdellovibrio sp. ArHS TaxID=1569284 RepID=UPI000582D3A3|nr:PrpF domain-containing protein [Bdellovibrio sp. ArHS]KHD87545.1 MAG: PrpF family protein [Bdellovibrio sp. ArHS]